MAIMLPSSPAPRAVTPRLLTRRRDLEPIFGGPVSRVQRLGSRWAMDFELPPMPYEKAMAWIAALTKGDAETVVMKVPQPGFDPGSPGTTLVNGAGQLGKTLNVDGFGAYTVKAGQFLSVIISGQRFLYQASADVAASAGAAALSIEPMIRRSPPNNAVVEMAPPYIEGFLSGRETSWTVDLARTVGLSFTITERE